MPLSIKDYLIVIAHSLAFFLFSYLFVWILQSLVTILAAYHLDVPTVWHIDRVDFMIPERAWDFSRVRLIFSSGPLFSLIFGIVSLIIYNQVMMFNGLLKQFFLWAFFHGWTNFWGALFVGTLTGRGFGHVVEWLYLQDTARLLISMSALGMLFYGGALAARPAMITANSYLNKLSFDGRGLWLTAQMLIPAIVGLFISTMLAWPGELVLRLPPYTILIMIIPVYMRRQQLPDIYFDEEPIKIKLSYKFVVSALAFIALMRILLHNGIRFG
ncbi:MAG TPA: hypothetical protein VLH16_00995 [Bacteroidales bacterium]|nr:hypothetical protein [Bacteroidales bacterium]